MIGLDTNVLVRYLTQDDDIQSEKATTLIERDLSIDNPGYVSAVVVAETAWVLERTYGWSGPELGSIMEQLLQADILVLEHDAEVSAAAARAIRGGAAFTDALIGALALEAGCSYTATFDKKMLRLAGFKPV
jgi:predicted nucleic-acid-binding protein